MAKGSTKWKRVKLGEIVERHVERVRDVAAYSRFVGVDDLDTEDLRLRRHGVIGIDEVPPTFRFVFREGMVLVPTRRPRLRKCAVAPFDGLTGEKLLVLKPIARSDLHPAFVPHLLASPAVQNWNIGKEIGSVTPHFRWVDMAEFEFALPPVEEQRRIAAVLREVRTVIECATTLRDAASTNRRAWLRSSVEGLLRAAPRIVLLGELLDGSPDSGCSAPERDKPTGYWVLGLSSLTDSGYVASEYKAVDRTAAMLSARLFDGDLLITRSNTRERVGFVGRFVDDGREVSFPDTMMRLRASKNRVTPEWLELLLQSPPIRGAIQSMAAGTSASMKKINRRNLLTVRVPDISSTEQQRQVDAFTKLRDAEKTAASRVAKACELRRALIAEALQA